MHAYAHPLKFSRTKTGSTLVFRVTDRGKARLVVNRGQVVGVVRPAAW